MKDNVVFESYHQQEAVTSFWSESAKREGPTDSGERILVERTI